jgi:hypothetical protein
VGQEGISGALGDPFKGKEGVGDFFAPFYRVRFLTPSPNQVDQYGPDGEQVGVGVLSLEAMEIASTDGATEVKFDDGNVAFLRSFATSLEVVDEGGGASTATLHLEPTYEDYLYIVKNKLIQFGAVMVIEYGWLGQGGDYFGASDVISSDPHYYVIQTPSLSINNLDISIDIVGSDIFGYAATQRTTSRTWDRKDSQYKTDLGILKALVGPMGLTIDTSLTNEPPAGTSGLTTPGAGVGVLALDQLPAGNVTGVHVERPLEGEPEIVEQTELDWVFFNDLCTSNNCSFFTVGTTIFLADKNVVKTRQPSYRLLLFQQMQTEKDVPILNLSANALDQLFQPATARETCANSANPDTNEVGANIVDPATADFFTYLGTKTVAGKDSAPGATVSLSDKESATPDPKFADNQTGKVWSVPWAMPNKEEMTRQPARDGVLIGADSANVTTPGLPSVVPNMLVELNGAGQSFDGAYYVLKATHRIDTGGYETTMELTRDTSTADLEVGPQAASQPPSTNTPATDTSGLEAVSASGDQIA